MDADENEQERRKRTAAMRDFYSRADAAIAEWSARARAECRGCGECCHFDVADHILYASGLEREYLRAAAALPECSDADETLLAAGLRCPFQSGGLCRARDARTLGCRLHFCSTATEDFAEYWHAGLKALHEALGADWDYRPLLPIH